ncbi:alpha/beta hydrolase [Pseudomonas sp. HR96]|uniref:alpha/beta fold hydrolase n=1 Tax=Pseudomonas sp. HR96 TaxID=1027966 RepID=UPI002A751D2C|nr:alpha/beta hydrolase [Pseudomonas sp. HR96]WPO98507.1 alpha/beta hydrolase [Pseudomonas sp. HR96]
MSVQQRNNVNLMGANLMGANSPAANDKPTLVFAHGFGCDQNMWRFVVPAFAADYRILMFDLVGAGLSDASAYDRVKYASLQGYACDLLEILDEYVEGPAIFVGHSVAAIIGLLADLQAPERFAAHVMIGASPCYLNQPGYVGGFEADDIQSLLQTLESNYLGWSSTVAPMLMGAPDRPELGAELAMSFSRTDPQIAKHFAAVTYTCDHRADVARVTTPVLILQCSDDMVVPQEVGRYLQANMANATLRVIDNIGHLPHVSSPNTCIQAISEYLPTLLRPAHAD